MADIGELQQAIEQIRQQVRELGERLEAMERKHAWDGWAHNQKRSAEGQNP